MASEFIIDTSLNTKGVDAGASKINSTMQNTAKSVEQSANKMKSSVNNAMSSNNKVPTEQYKQLDNELASLGRKYDAIAEKEYRFLQTGGSEKSSTYKRYEYDLDKLEQEMDDVIAKQRQMESSGTAFQTAPIREAGNEAQATAKKMGELDKSQKKANRSAKKGTNIFGGLSKALKGNRINMKKGIMTLLKYTLGIRSLFVLFNKLRRALVDGFNNMAHFNNGVNPVNQALSSLKSSLLLLKNSFASAFAPILTVVAPILTKFIDYLADAVTMLGMFIAKLTGAKTFTKAKKTQEQYAEATEDAAEAQDKLNNKLADYDKLMVIDQNASSSSGKGSSGPDYNSMFEEVDLDDSAVNWAEKFKKAWENADFTEIGATLGKKLNEALESIPWDDIKNTSFKIGKSVATFLNGVFETPNLFTNIGKTIGESLNTAIELAFGFVENFNWSSFGTAVADGLSGMFNSIDFAKLGTTLSDGLKGIYEAILSLMTDFDWQGLGKSIVDLISSIDWIGLFVLNTTIRTTITSAIMNLMTGIVTGLLDNIADLLEELGLDGIAGFIRGISSGLSEGVSAITGFFNDFFINPIKSLFGVDSSIPELMGIAMSVIDGMISVFTNSTEKIKTAALNIFKAVTEKFVDIKKWFSDKFSGAVDGIKTAFSSDNLKKYFTSVWKNIKETFGNVSDWFKTTFTKAWKAVKDVFSKGGKVFTGIKDGILNGLKTVINALIDGINKVIKVPFQGINTALNKIKKVSILGVKPFSSLPTISIPKIPKLATGAVIPPNHEFLAMLGDQKSGTNIETPLKTMIEAFNTALDQRGSVGMPEKIDVYLPNGKVLAQAVWDEEEKYYKQTGNYRPSYA